uniref:Mediator of RNA polymerase II transcription subunit 11 n=1 Tax=Ditylenchus dipsaci TaxID=166011 RepID=A0A915D7S6_9BILA
MTEELGEAPDLDQRIEKLAEVDKKIYEALECAKEILQTYDRDRQISRSKMEESYKKYERCVDDIYGGISQQLTYMEQMCVGAEHQGSTFAIQQQSELARNRMQALMQHELSKVSAVADASMESNYDNGDISGTAAGNSSQFQ